MLADGFERGLNAVGGALEGVGDSIGDWFSNLDDNIRGFFTDLINNLRGWFNNLISDLKNIDENIREWFEQLFQDMGKMLDWFNPLSENFFLKVAFIPDSGFWSDYSTRWDGLLKTKLGFFFQIKDTFSALTDSVQSKVTTWEGIKIDISRWSSRGEIEIVNGYAIQQYGEKMRFWIGGMIYFFTGAWLIRKLSVLVGEGR